MRTYSILLHTNKLHHYKEQSLPIQLSSSLYILSLLLENGMLIVFSLSNFVFVDTIDRGTHICDFLGGISSLLSLLLALSLCSFPYYLNKQVFSKIQASDCKALSLARKVKRDTTHLHIYVGAVLALL